MSTSYNLPGQFVDVTPSGSDVVLPTKTVALYATNQTNAWETVEVDSILPAGNFATAVPTTVTLDVPPQSVMPYYGVFTKIYSSGTDADKVLISHQ